MLDALRTLGVDVDSDAAAGRAQIHGCGIFPVKQADLFLGNAGTAFRPLTAALAMMGGDYQLSGVPRMHERPIGDLVDALRALGGVLTYEGVEGYPPLRLQAGQPDASRPIRVRGSVSSQFLTALLMAAPIVAGHRN